MDVGVTPAAELEDDVVDGSSMMEEEDEDELVG